MQTLNNSTSSKYIYYKCSELKQIAYTNLRFVPFIIAAAAEDDVDIDVDVRSTFYLLDGFFRRLPLFSIDFI